MSHWTCKFDVSHLRSSYPRIKKFHPTHLRVWFYSSNHSIISTKSASFTKHSIFFPWSYLIMKYNETYRALSPFQLSGKIWLAQAFTRTPAFNFHHEDASCLRNGLYFGSRTERTLNSLSLVPSVRLWVWSAVRLLSELVQCRVRAVGERTAVRSRCNA